MKKITTFFLCAILVWNARGQEITLNPDSVYIEADANQTQIEASSSITNVSGFELNVDWQWNSIELPQGWTVEFCESNGCFPSSMDTMFFIGLDDTVPLSVLFYPNGISGTGKIKIRLYSASPGIHIEERLTIVANATSTSATVHIENDADISLFPNPADEILNVEVGDEYIRGKWQVIDSRGCIISLPQYWSSGKIRVSDMPAGKYYLRLMSSENKLLVLKPFLVTH
jgi:type IX secretion system substrate protein